MTTNSIVESDEGTTYTKGRTLGTSTTHGDPAKCSTCSVTCEDQWSISQLKALELLSQDGRLLDKAVARAKRTAGNYAAMFLEDEGTARQGRFYWPGLAAFAAKQVVEGIEYADKNLGSFVAQVRAMAGLSLYYLLKGNFWVFVEVVPWKLFYRDRGKELFFHCIDRRDVASYDARAKATTQSLPWAMGENQELKRSIERRLSSVNLANLSWNRLSLQDARGALAEMDNCRATAHLKRGFEKLASYEDAPSESALDRRQKAELAHASALHFLDHEQRLHLQAMIYNHPDFQFAWDNNDLGRSVNRYLPITGARDPDLVFNFRAQIDNEAETADLRPAGLAKEDVSVRMELDDGKLYNVSERMVYVRRILDQYHFLMQTRHRNYMVQQLRRIASWKDVQ